MAPSANGGVFAPPFFHPQQSDLLQAMTIGFGAPHDERHSSSLHGSDFPHEIQSPEAGQYVHGQFIPQPALPDGE